MINIGRDFRRAVEFQERLNVCLTSISCKHQLLFSYEVKNKSHCKFQIFRILGKYCNNLLELLVINSTFDI